MMLPMFCIVCALDASSNNFFVGWVVMLPGYTWDSTMIFRFAGSFYPGVVVVTIPQTVMEHSWKVPKLASYLFKQYEQYIQCYIHIYVYISMYTHR